MQQRLEVLAEVLSSQTRDVREVCRGEVVRQTSETGAIEWNLPRDVDGGAEAAQVVVLHLGSSAREQANQLRMDAAMVHPRPLPRSEGPDNRNLIGAVAGASAFDLRGQRVMPMDPDVRARRR